MMKKYKTYARNAALVIMTICNIYVWMAVLGE